MTIITKFILVGLSLSVMGLFFGVTGSLLSKNIEIEDKFISFGGGLLAFGIFISALAFLCWCISF